jgi:polysaccharide export outer membrane protein
MDKRIVTYFLAFFILSFGYGCSTQYAAKTPPTVDLAQKKKTEQLNEAIVLTAKSHANIAEDYRIGPEDLLEIEAYNVEELKKTLRVNSQGDIALPLIGIIRVRGMTTSELEKVITNKLEKYVEETVVNVFIKEYRSQRISVVGAVEKSQVYAVTGQMYLIDMLMVAGGLSKESGSICYVMRPTNKNSPNSRTETLVIDLDELLIKGNLSLNIPVFAGDVISVPKGGVVFVDGAVKNPGVYTMRGKTTLVQALAMAQGVDSVADLSEIRIFRDNGKGDRDVITADYEAIKNGTNPDILLAENDIIIVPKSGVKNFFNGFINTIKGFISFGKTLN